MTLVQSKSCSQEREEHFADLARTVTDADRFRLEDPVCKWARDLLEKYMEVLQSSALPVAT